MTEPPAAPPRPTFRAPARPLTANPFEWIDWILGGIMALFDWVWQLGTQPVNATIFYMGIVVQGVLDAWASLTIRSTYLVEHRVGEGNLVKAGLVPWARTGLTYAQQGIYITGQFLKTWLHPHTAGLGTLAFSVFGPLGRLLGELLSFVVYLRTGTKLVPPLVAKALEETELLAEAIEVRAAEAFGAWQGPINTAIAWSNWLFDPRGLIRQAPWLASVAEHGAVMFGHLVNALLSGVPPEVRAAQLDAQFPPRPAGDVSAAFRDGRTLALGAVQSAIARFRSGSL